MKRTKKNTANEAEAQSTLTVIQLAEKYLQHLEDAGKTQATLLSYWIDLTVACRVLGEKTPIDSLTEATVAAFFESDLVTKTRTGKPKAPVTIEKTRRVLRMALTWAQREGLIAEAPVPAGKPKAAPATTRKEPEAAADTAPATEEPAPAPKDAETTPSEFTPARKPRGRKRAPKPDADGTAAEQAEG